MALKFNLAELHEQRPRKQHERALAVIAECGGQKPERMLVPEDDPANNMVMDLTAEKQHLFGEPQHNTSATGAIARYSTLWSFAMTATCSSMRVGSRRVWHDCQR